MKQLYKLWKMNPTRSSGTLNAIYHNGTYLLLFGRRKLRGLKIS